MMPRKRTIVMIGLMATWACTAGLVKATSRGIEDSPPELEYMPDEVIVKFEKPVADVLAQQLAAGKSVEELK